MAEKPTKFTKTALAEVVCPPDKTRVRIRDNVVPGLTFHVTKDGHRAFYFRKKVLGKDSEIRIGTDAECTVEQARKRAVELASQFISGRNPQAERRENRTGTTLGDLWTVYRRTVTKGTRTMI